MATFVQRLKEATEVNQSLLCVGLDPDPEKMAIDDVATFNKAIVDATKDLVCAYKPNLPFYEALGLPGLEALQETVSYIRHQAPDILVLGDGKRGDIGSTDVHYAKALFEVWGFDSATINPYGGRDAVQPFLDYRDKGIFIWCRSSNPGASEIQDLMVAPEGDQERRPLYEWIATLAARWNEAANVGVVVGAPYPEELRRVREICPDMPILIPGVGAQQGPLERSVTNGIDHQGRNAVINVSRSVIYASRDEKDFAPKAREAAEGIRRYINNLLTLRGQGWGEPSQTELGKEPTSEKILRK